MRHDSFDTVFKRDLMQRLGWRGRLKYRLTVRWLVFRYAVRWWKPWARRMP